MEAKIISHRDNFLLRDAGIGGASQISNANVGRTSTTAFTGTNMPIEARFVVRVGNGGGVIQLGAGISTAGATVTLIGDMGWMKWRKIKVLPQI